MENAVLPHQYSCQSSEEMADIKKLSERMRENFEGKPEELIPMLQMIQKSLGYLPEPALLEVAKQTGMPKATVFSVATFYAQFRLQPVGRHTIKICTGTACHVRGAGRIKKEVQGQLDVEPGQTTEDRLFTLETVACFGSCALAPVVVADESVYGRMNSKKAKNILDKLAESSSEVDHAKDPSQE